MARPREFDFDVALERAMQAFWSKGYESTSMQDVCRATGLTKSSLYAAFGGKQSIYGLALDRYEEAVVRRIRAAIAEVPSVKDGLRQFAQQLIDDVLAGPGRRGCFIGNCAAEMSKGDRAAAARARRSLDRIEAAFRDALYLGQTKGELGKSLDVRATARFITSGIQGLRLVGKANPSREVLEDIARIMLKCLE